MSPTPVVMSDLSGRVLFASPQTWALLGLSASEELLGKACSIMSLRATGGVWRRTCPK